MFNNTREAYNPFAMRHHAGFMTWFQALRDIQAGEEVENTYLSHGLGSDLDDVRVRDDKWCVW